LKLLREHINEKFTEDSDPIADMNIGMMHQIKLWMESIGEPFIDKNHALVYCAGYGKLDFVKYLLAAGADVHAENDRALRWASSNGHTEVVKILLAAGADVHANNDAALRYASAMGRTETVKVLKDHIAKEKRKKVKESLNEKFTEDSDPIHDMNIGVIKFINDWINIPNIYSHIKNYIIRKDLKIDADSVDISWDYMDIIPEYIHFGKITKDFSCHFNEKSKLHQLPEYIGGILTIYTNKKINFTKKYILKFCKISERNIKIQTYNYPKYTNFTYLTIK